MHLQLKLVKFTIQGQDHFAVKNTESGKYIDLKDNYWWDRGSPYFPSCLTTDKQNIEKIFEMYSADEQEL